jgi:deazaflavin-dependent oxidoreductase (nitroreductase family)
MAKATATENGMARSTIQAGTPSRSFLARFLHASAGLRPMARLSKAFHVALFRLSRGKVMGKWFGAPVLVIEATGRRSGRRRRTPVTFCEVGGAWIVVAINAGSDTTPAWWVNLRGAREATILLRGQRVPVSAREAHDQERERLWRAYAAQTPVIEEFRAYTDRTIPVVVLERLADEHGAG